jgi:hypothetical protein
MSEVLTFSAGTPAPATLVGAIAALMNDVHTVAKRGVNEFHRYRYARMEDILQEAGAARPMCKRLRYSCKN